MTSHTLLQTRARLRHPGGRVRTVLWLCTCIAACIAACAPARAQYSSETFQQKQASEQYDERGFQKGQSINVDGKLAVSTVNGGVSYSYPLDRFTQKSYGFQVDLNYCNAVPMASFKAYHSGTDKDGEKTGPDFWDKFTRNRPLWIIGVNGFAVQTLSLVSDYMPPLNDQQSVWEHTKVPWLVEGYDFCNRMNRMENTGQYDVISLLRADGSVLELRNPYIFGEDGSVLPNHAYVTGHYFEDAMNATGHAVVDFDTVRLMDGMRTELRAMINSAQGQADTAYWKKQLYQYLPRRVRYYPGDGLEYVFVEHQVPYGWSRFNGAGSVTGGQTAGPTIFYLTEINDASGVVLQLGYSRHTDPGDGSCGRALVQHIGEYVRFGYHDRFMTVEAHGRTTTLQFASTLPLVQFEEQGGEPGSKKTFTGLVQSLRDPEQRLTSCTYENYTRTFRGYNHPYKDVELLVVTAERLTGIQEPAAHYAISYHEGKVSEREIVFTPNPTPTGALADWRQNNAAEVVTKYNNDHQWLTTERYCFDGLSTADNPCSTTVQGFPRTVYTLTDQRTQQTKTTTYTFQQQTLPRYRTSSPPSPLALPLVYTALLSTEEHADGRTVSTATDYAAQWNAALILPVRTETHVATTTQPALRTAVATMSYDLVAPGGFNGPSDVISMYTMKVHRKTAAERNPQNDTEILWKDITEYLHLPLLSTPQQVAQIQWDKFASLRRYDSLYQAGLIPCCWEDMHDSLHVFDTLDTRPFWAPPFYSLVKESYRTAANNRYLGGKKIVYEETSRAPGANRRGLPLRDSILSEDRAEAVLGMEYTYGAQSIAGGYGWLYTDERFPVRQRNANGAVQEQAYRFASRTLPTATLLHDDGTTKAVELRDRLFALGLEKPLLQRSLLRNARTGMTDTLQMRNEWTYYGLLGGQRDYNGYFSRFDYDHNGRLLTAQLPRDFLGSDVTCNERYDGLKRYDAPVTWTESRVLSRTVLCPDNSEVNTSWSSSRDYSTLRAGKNYHNGPCPPEILGSGMAQPSGGTGQDGAGVSVKRGQEQVLATIGTVTHTSTYEAEQHDVVVCGFDVTGAENIFAAQQTLRGGSFRFFVSSMQGRCFTLHVDVRRLSDSAVLAHRSFVLNCSQGGVPTAVFGGGKGESVLSGSGDVEYMFDASFTVAELQSIAQSGTPGCQVELSVATPGARITVVKEGEDKRPHWRLDGVFDLPVAQRQFTLSYEYSRIMDDMVIQRVKTDDRWSSVNYPAGMCRPMRYSESRHDLGGDRVVERTRVLIGDPTQPVRSDTVSTVYTGMGLARRSTDQEGYIVRTDYDMWGRPVKVLHADSSYTTMEYTIGTPAVLLGDNTQNFYGFCERVLTQVYDGTGGLRQSCVAQYFDALGRLRREVQDTMVQARTTTMYDYDDALNRLSTVTNPNGHTTQYWYDGFGRVKYKYQPDMGYISYAYDALGNVRFIQTQAQANDGRLGFTQYDDFGRVTLIGEARLGTGGGHGGGGIALVGGGSGKQKRERVLLNPPAGRLTDQINASVLQDGGVSASVTANATVWLPPGTSIPQFWTPEYLTETFCIPQPVIGPSAAPYLAHPVAQYTDPGVPLSTATTFENIAQYPQNARIAIHYDALPATQGAVWFHFPVASRWNALAPTGVVRNLKGREAAVAYRQHAGEPYHFVVMSYDERGRVEALLRYTENLGFDAVYYSYNALNAITSIRVADPLRQHTTWYSYDWNGRVDTVWTKLSAAGNGLGVANPVYPASQARPTDADIVYSYTKRGQVAEMQYPAVATVVGYRYNSRALLDSLRARVNGVEAFVQGFEYNGAGQLVEQRWQHGGQSAKRDNYGYSAIDGARQGFLNVWWHDLGGAQERGHEYIYDNAGNRRWSQYWSISQQIYGSSGYFYDDPTGPNRLTSVRDSVEQNGVLSETWYRTFSYNANGSLVSRTSTGAGVNMSETFGYDGIQNLLKQYIRSTGSATEDWRYRYSASGEREQKRLYSGTQQASREWTYYLLDGAQRQLAVYEGMETQTSSCGQSMGDAPVYVWASEYLSYGQGRIHSVSIRPTTPTQSRKEYKVQDYLGTTRLVIEPDGMGGGAITGRYDHGPYGEVLWQSAPVQRLSFIDRERDEESGDHNFGVRQYEHGIGRFMAVDPLWEKYRSLTPYHYGANNPLTYVDPSGLEVDVTQVEKYDDIVGTTHGKDLVDDISTKSGLQLFTDNGRLRYKTDSDGKPLVTTDANGNLLGSATMRDQLVKIIDAPEVIKVGLNPGGGSRALDNNIILLDPKQIGEFMANSVGVDPTTLGWGMTFTHESLHTPVGGGLEDSHSFGSTGPVVDRMNVIRQELNAQGGNFGQRTSYEGMEIKGVIYIPFSNQSKALLQAKKVPISEYIFK